MRMICDRTLNMKNGWVENFSKGFVHSHTFMSKGTKWVQPLKGTYFAPTWQMFSFYQEIAQRCKFPISAYKIINSIEIWSGPFK